jgi:hypothetical protein
MVSDSSAIGIALGEDGDIFFKNGMLQTVQGKEFTAQNIDERIDTRYGELHFLKNSGIDREAIIHSSNTYEVSNIIKNVIVSTDTVDRLTSFDITKDNANRELNITFEVQSIFGETSGDITL